MTHPAYASRWGYDQQYLHQHEPGLTLTVGAIGEQARITGTFLAPRLDGRMMPFELVFQYPGQDPYELPDVYDLAHRFPRDPDRHIESEGRFCLWLSVTAPIVELRRPGGLGVVFTHTRAFLTRQLTYEARERRGQQPFWTGPEWEHFEAAYPVWAAELLGDLPGSRIARLITAAGTPPANNAACPCGSRRTFSTCHRTTVRALRNARSNEAAWAAVLHLREERRHAHP